MAFNKEHWQEKFKTLSTRYGGSILKEKGKLPQDQVVVFIGLGGLGSKAVNAIKAETMERLENPDRRFFLVVDTCRKDMNDISIATAQDLTADEKADTQAVRPHGCITEDEKMALYSGTYQIKSLGHHIDSWLNRSVMDQVTVDDKGAQGKRQIGRVMLFGKDDKYNEYLTKLRDFLSVAKRKAEADGKSMKIYIIAGISGGTGSGTVVDFTYMVRNAVSDFDLAHRKIEGIIFTPDVQKNEQGMDPNYYRNIVCRNFYAAFKEIDYFYNNRSRKKAYECPIGEQVEAYKEDIFDECTIVSRMASGIEAAPSAAQVIQKLASALAFELGGIVGITSKGEKQSYEAFYSNINATFDAWWDNNSNGKGMKMPDFLPYRYSSIGYSSFYVPRDELMAYCANMLVEKLAKQWIENDVKDEEITKQMAKVSLQSLRAFASKLFELAQCEMSFEDIQEREKPKDGAGLLPVKNCLSFLELMKETGLDLSKTSEVKRKISKASGAKKAAFVDPIIEAVNAAFTKTDSRGPVYAINLLSARHLDKTGILPRIGEMLDELTTEARNWKDELKDTYNYLKKKAEEYDGKVSISPADLAAFTDSCEKYGKDLVKAAILENARDYLESIYMELNDKNRRVFEIYTWTFDFLLDMLKKDSAYTLSTDRHKEGHTTTFTFDLASFQDGDPKSEIYKEFFKTYVDEKNLDDASREFIQAVFVSMKDLLDPVGREAGDVKPEDVVAILRNYFSGAFKEFASETVEKFCVVAYASSATEKIDPKKLTTIWESDDGLKQAGLKAAAQAIESQLKPAILLSSSDSTRSVENYTSYSSVYGLQETPGINKKFEKDVAPLSTEWPEFISYKRIFGFPVGFLADLREYRRVYNDSVGKNGVHLDEVDDDWRYAFPNLYDYNIAKFERAYVADGEDVTESDKRRMTRILSRAKKAKKMGLLNIETSIVDLANDDSDGAKSETQEYYSLTYGLLRPLKDSDEIICNKLTSVLLDNADLSFADAVKAAGYAFAEPLHIHWTFKETEYNTMRNATDFGDDVIFGNFITLLRSNYAWEQKLYRAVKLFSHLQELYEKVKAEIRVKNTYNERLTMLCRMICADLLTPYVNPKTGKIAGYQLRYGKRADDIAVVRHTHWSYIDRKMSLYLFFTEALMQLDDVKYKNMRKYQKKVSMDLEDDPAAKAEAVKNIEWFLKQVKKTLEDDTYLGNEYESERDEEFATVLTDSEFGYNAPDSSSDREDVSVVIKNLLSFYKELKKKLEKELDSDNEDEDDAFFGMQKKSSAGKGKKTSDGEDDDEDEDDAFFGVQKKSSAGKGKKTSDDEDEEDEEDYEDEEDEEDYEDEEDEEDYEDDDYDDEDDDDFSDEDE